MRYSIHWLPAYQTPLYIKGKNWFEQAGFFQEILDNYKSELSHFSFIEAFKIPKKYGFHHEILPPFSLKKNMSEATIIDFCQSIAKTLSVYDIKLSLMQQGKSLLLYHCYKNNILSKLQHDLYMLLLNVANFETIMSFSLQEYVCCQENFQIVLSNTNNILLHKDLERIAQIYWSDILENILTIDTFSLCFQKNKKMPFVELSRFSL